uniref:Integrin subunit alpha 10 n=1 Tax=Apteryx owenii TaxID=8824 RepID=A0A8B9PKI9_APTOW
NRGPRRLAVSAGLCIAFNVDVSSPRLFQGPPEAQFGYKVLQRAAGGRKWLLVGAPWDGPAGDRRGDVYKCLVGPPNSTCTKANLGNATVGKSGGRGGGTPSGACAPLWSQECGTSVFSTGICTRLDGNLRPVETLAPTAQRCSTYMDIVIVLDGSNSIYPWYEVQNFLSNILSKFFIGPGQIQVGVLQYGELAVHEWTLGQYRTAREVAEAARNISRQEGRETRTAFAIHRACTEAFSPERGGRRDATRLMIVVTDGESHDGDELPDALEECEKRNVTRYAIAVLGHYLRRQQDPEDFIREIKSIASDPDEKYFFNVTDEAALNDIVDALGDRIFSLEGTPGANASSFELEMSQIGFSTHLLEDGILFGMVGAYDWDGAVLKEGRGGRIVPPRKAFEEEFPLELKNHAAYLGYTVSSLRLPGGKRLYVAGAPRFQHKGKVILFELGAAGDVAVAQALVGEQIGSYFGSEVCALDADGDGATDVLLVAAPMYLGAQSKETGRVYVYRVGQVRGLGGHSGIGMQVGWGGRSGIEVHGRIMGDTSGQALSYFGRSLDGQMDLDGDGLVDLAVGAQGAAVVLRSRPIVQVNASLTVEPSAISVIQKNCQRSGADAVCLRAKVCFRAGTRYNVSLEERTLGARAAFDSSARRLLQKRLELSLGRQSCVRFPFHVLDTTDYLRPLSFTVRLGLAESSPGPVLDEKSPTTVRKLVGIPFFKDCGDDDECVTDLVLQASMDIAGSSPAPGPHVLRKGRRKVVVDVTLENKKENAYNTSLRLRFSRNLLFSSLVLQVWGHPYPIPSCPRCGVHLIPPPHGPFSPSFQPCVAGPRRPPHPGEGGGKGAPTPSAHPASPLPGSFPERQNRQHLLPAAPREQLAAAGADGAAARGRSGAGARRRGVFPPPPPPRCSRPPLFFRQTVLEILQRKQVPISLWILVGSIVGGLLLLALIIFCLWKVRAGLGGAAGARRPSSPPSSPSRPSWASSAARSPPRRRRRRRRSSESRRRPRASRPQPGCRQRGPSPSFRPWVPPAQAPAAPRVMPAPGLDAAGTRTQPGEVGGQRSGRGDARLEPQGLRGAPRKPLHGGDVIGETWSDRSGQATPPIKLGPLRSCSGAWYPRRRSLPASGRRVLLPKPTHFPLRERGKKPPPKCTRDYRKRFIRRDGSWGREAQSDGGDAHLLDAQNPPSAPRLPG